MDTWINLWKIPWSSSNNKPSCWKLLPKQNYKTTLPDPTWFWKICISPASLKSRILKKGFWASFLKIRRIKSLLLRMGLSPYGLAIFPKGSPSTSDGSCQTTPFSSCIFPVLTTWPNVGKIINPGRLEEPAADTGVFTLQRKYWEKACILGVSADGKGSGPMVWKVSCQEGLGRGETKRGLFVLKSVQWPLMCTEKIRSYINSSL